MNSTDNSANSTNTINAAIQNKRYVKRQKEHKKGPKNTKKDKLHFIISIQTTEMGVKCKNEEPDLPGS